MLALREPEPVDGGAGDTMVDRARTMAWCIAGIHISPCSNERTVHIGMDPREFNMEDYNEVDMDAIANSLLLRA